MTVGQRIAQKRKEKGLSQEALGERLGVSRQAIYKWESDAALPEIEKLVKLSREFDLSIDWLLGEGDESRELTPDQLRMVEEIVSRYLAAQSPEKTIILRETVEAEPQEIDPEGERETGRSGVGWLKRWGLAWAGLAALVAIVMVFFNLFSRLDQMRQENQNLQMTVANIRSDVNNQIYGITSRVEEVLQRQNDLTAEQSARVTNTDYRANTVTVEARALPRTYVEGMGAEFLLDSGGQTVTVPGVLGADHAFTARITGPLSDDITVSVVLLTGDQRQTQLLEQFSDLYSSSFPALNIENGLWGWGNKVEEYVWIDPEPAWADGVRAAAADIRVGLFRDQKLLAWYAPVEGIPPNFGGFDEENTRFFRLEGEWTLEPDHVYCVAALVTDEYGRERMYPDTQVKYDPKRDLAEQYAENGVVYSPSTDPTDWEY